ncbi:MAG TPA: pyridoxal phosphate-dependent aminotransferase, partial [Acidimicrobiales bacterium]|nr:pyridoxal phosphate-dependent aminotransferase [Acidimicrobiales bacterium]
ISTVGTRREWPPCLPLSPTLSLNERAAWLRAQGQRVVHLGFGEAGLPVLPELRERLGVAASENSYAPVAGTEAARGAAASWFDRRSVPTEADQVVFAPGSKPLLWALVTALPGDVVLPQPSWVTYAAQAALAAKRVVKVPVPPGRGGVPDPERLEAQVRGARRAGADPGILVVTVPDNPTGTLAPRELVEQLCEVAERLDLVVIADEIYRDLAYEPDRFCSPVSVAPERVVVTGGLSKALALGGWRVGFARMPSGPVGDALRPRVLGIASEVWSALASPMLRVAAWALEDPEPVRDFVDRSRRLHANVTAAVWRALDGSGVPCPRPEAAFYLYPDFGPLRGDLARKGIRDGRSLAHHLLESHGIAALPGEAFGDEGSALRLRLAVSLLYGDTEERRWASLRADDPASLPWIRSSVEQLAAATSSLRDGRDVVCP